MPRILFVDPRGSVRTEVFNEGGNPSYRHFYHDASQITSAMDRAGKLLAGRNEL